MLVNNYAKVKSKTHEGIELPKIKDFKNMPHGHDVCTWLLSEIKVPKAKKARFSRCMSGTVHHDRAPDSEEKIVISRRVISVANNQHDVAFYYALASFGDKITNISKLAREFGTSRSRIRRRLQNLEDAKLIKRDILDCFGSFKVRFYDRFADDEDVAEKLLGTEKKRSRRGRRLQCQGAPMFGEMRDGECSEQYSVALIDWLQKVEPLQGDGFFRNHEIEGLLREFGRTIHSSGVETKYLYMADEMLEQLTSHLVRLFVGKADTPQKKLVKQLREDQRKLIIEHGSAWIAEGYAEAVNSGKVEKVEKIKIEQPQPREKQSAPTKNHAPKKAQVDLYNEDGTLTEEGERIVMGDVFDYKPKKRANRKLKPATEDILAKQFGLK